MEAVIELDGVRRAFGNVQALDGLTLSIPRGSVVGLLGLNGAGKTTTMRLLTGLLRADAGSVRLLGADPWTMEPERRRRVGYLAETDFPFPGADLAWAAAFSASFFPRWDAQLLQHLVQRLGIPVDRPYANLSRGQQRKFALALTLAQRPEVLLLDDPAQGLDVSVRREFVEAVLPLLEAAETTVVFSSHVMSDVERMADRIAVLHRGRLVLHEALDDLKERVRQVVLSGDAAPPCGRVLRRRERRGERSWTVMDLDLEGLAALRARGLVADVGTLGLEDVFVDLVAGADEEEAGRAVA